MVINQALGGDLNVLTAKIVITQLEGEYGVSLKEKKEFLKGTIKDMVLAMQ